MSTDSIGSRSLNSEILCQTAVLFHQQIVSSRILVSVASRSLDKAKEVVTLESHKEC
jgi:hypothetical protein